MGARRVRPFSKAIDSVKGNIQYTWNSIQRLKNLYKTSCGNYDMVNRFFNGLGYVKVEGKEFLTAKNGTITIRFSGKSLVISEVAVRGSTKFYKKPKTVEEFAWIMAQEDIKLWWTPKSNARYFSTLNWQ